jgi:hypothetical protein
MSLTAIENGIGDGTVGTMNVSIPAPIMVPSPLLSSTHLQGTTQSTRNRDYFAYDGWRVAMLIDGLNIEIVVLDGSPPDPQSDQGLPADPPTTTAPVYDVMSWDIDPMS